MALDKFDKIIQPRQYAMMFNTYWKSNDVNILFVQIADREITNNNRVYYKRLWTIRGDIQNNLDNPNTINIQEEITWTSPNKLLIIDKKIFLEGHLNTTFKHLRENFSNEEIANQLINYIVENQYVQL